jgi:hypothetical protein
MVETFKDEGLDGLTRKIVSKKDHFIATAGVHPSLLNGDLQQEVLSKIKPPSFPIDADENEAAEAKRKAHE